jgi:hypothetical protein
MHNFAIRRRRWWVVHALGRNPLLRPSDRIEACVIVVAILIALAAAPICATAGVAVYGSHARLYAQHAHTCHTVAATVIETSARAKAPHITSIAARVTWPADGGVHTNWYRTSPAVKPGDRIDIWVDSKGLPTTPPTPVSQAAIDAVAAGGAIWIALTLSLIACVAVTRSPLNRIRGVQWEREIRSLADGGRTNRPQ